MNEKMIKKQIKKLVNGNHTRFTIKMQLKIESDQFDTFIDNEFKKKLEKQLSKPFYAGRKIRYQ